MQGLATGKKHYCRFASPHLAAQQNGRSQKGTLQAPIAMRKGERRNIRCASMAHAFKLMLLH